MKNKKNPEWHVKQFIYISPKIFISSLTNISYDTYAKVTLNVIYSKYGS